jgi:hypothetical protein
MSIKSDIFHGRYHNPADKAERRSAHNDPRIDPITGLKLLYGNGCHEHANCFTCPLTECNFSVEKYYVKRRSNTIR